MRSLVDRKAVTGLVLIILLGWCGLAWLASERQENAASALPSALSMRLLELGLAARPGDDALRMRLARKRLQIGQLTEARELVLRARNNPAFRAEVQSLLVEIDYGRWCAVELKDRSQRQHRQAELLATLDSVHTGSQELLLRVAALYRELEQPDKAARIFDALVRSGQLPDAERANAADAAWLEAGQPLAAAELQAFLARQGGPDGASHARLALERARLAGDTQALAALLASMRGLYPQDVTLLRLAIRLTEASDVRRAGELALELTRMQPGVSLYHREAARLAEASGRGLCALDQYMWLWRHEHRADDKARALRLARETWDLELLRELLDGPQPSQAPARGARPRKGCGAAERQRSAAQWEERFQLYEALGDTNATRELLARIVVSPDGSSLFWWRRKLELERRSDDYAAALSTLTQMLARFPDTGVREELANLQLATGATPAALATMQAAPSKQRDEPLLRRICELAAAAGDIAAERQAYSEIVAKGAATVWDYQRWLTLAPDRRSAADIAAEAAWRFQSFDMFYSALQLYARDGDERAQLALLELVQQVEPIARRVDYWQMRIAMQQTRAARAASSRNYAEAKAALHSADALLRHAAKQAPSKEQYASLWGAQHTQALDVGIATGDKALALRAFLATRSSLSARERVYLLIKLGQPDAALDEARRELGRERLPDSDRSVLENDALSLSRGRATDLQLQGNGLSMDGVQAFGATARVDYAEIAGGLRITLGYMEYQPVFNKSLLSTPVRDMSAALRGRYGRFALELGANVRDADTARPFGTLQARLAGDDERGTSLQVQGNGLSADNARLRVHGTADAIAFKTVVGLGKYFWAHGRAAAEAYYTRAERRLLGAGVTVDLGLGGTIELPAKLGHAGLRFFGRGAPRFPRPQSEPAVDPADVWLPAHSLWTGLGVNVGRGQLDAPLLFGRQLSYALDASVGWVWLVSSPGWSVTGQLAVSVLGADSLTLAATAGNVVGSSGFSGSLGYVVSFAD
jgi:hypothetical protein